MQLREYEIVKQTQINGVLWMPGPNTAELAPHVAKPLVERGDIRPITTKKKRGVTRNALGGIDRQMQAGSTRGAEQETSLGAGSPGVG